MSDALSAPPHPLPTPPTPPTPGRLDRQQCVLTRALLAEEMLQLKLGSHLTESIQAALDINAAHDLPFFLDNPRAALVSPSLPRTKFRGAFPRLLMFSTQLCSASPNGWSLRPFSSDGVVGEAGRNCACGLERRTERQPALWYRGTHSER